MKYRVNQIIHYNFETYVSIASQDECSYSDIAIPSFALGNYSRPYFYSNVDRSYENIHFKVKHYKKDYLIFIKDKSSHRNSQTPHNSQFQFNHYYTIRGGSPTSLVLFPTIFPINTDYTKVSKLNLLSKGGLVRFSDQPTNLLLSQKF